MFLFMFFHILGPKIVSKRFFFFYIFMVFFDFVYIHVRGIPAGFLKGKYGSPRQTEIGPEINKKWFSAKIFF